MPVPNEELMRNIGDSWTQLRKSLEESLNQLETEINDAVQVQHVCTDEWCTAVEHAIDDYSNFLFSIHEPRWLSQEESGKLKELKKRVHDIYAQYKVAAKK
jgi:hypothetical protein